ncbi:MAG: potassium channel family protein [Vicingaceae bacterium]
MRLFPSIRRFSRINIALFALFFVVLVGVVGYMQIENFRFFDAFYMTIITISTVGFTEVHPLSELGRLFTAFLIMTSFGIFAYAITAISSYLINGELMRYYKERKLDKTIGKLNNHIIVCGYGRNGRRAVEEFEAHKKPFIVVESDARIVSDLQENSTFLFIDGDAREDDVLLSAGIERAQALVCTMPDDADNLLTVLTARELNKFLTIISRASYDTSYKKLKLAGADNVIMPDKIGGAHMASLILKPDVIEFFDQLIMQDPEKPYVKEVLCSDLSGDNKPHSLGELKELNKSGVIILGIKCEDGTYLVNPSDASELDPGSKLFVLGTPLEISSL